MKLNYWEFPIINTTTRNEYISGQIIKIVGSKLEIPTQLLISKNRKREIVEARHIAMSLIKNNTSLPLKAIGGLFGKRDHSTVIHACKNVKDFLEMNNKDFTAKYNLIASSL